MFVYHRKAASQKVPNMSLHLRESAAPTTAIRVLNVVTCSTGSHLPSKDGRDGDLKFSGTSALHIFVESG